MAKYFGYLILITLTILVVKLLWERKKLRNDFEISNATITGLGTMLLKNGSREVKYQFITKKGDLIKGSQNFLLVWKNREKIVGRSIPCAYSQADPENSEILILEDTWKKYGISYPDSLNWLKEFVDDYIYSN